jgi:hypothetical protein
MFIKSSILALVLASSTFARELIIERDGRPFYPRRFGQEQCGGIGGQIGAACNGAICGVFGGRVPGTLLAAADPCAQQDLADDIINASKDQDAATAAVMVQLAVQFRQCEKNTPPDFSTNPPALRNSVFCLKAPANSELDGLVQAQDPANDPNLFFDVATKSTITLGSQANTFAFGSNGAVAADPAPAPVESSSSAAEAVPTPVDNTPTVEATASCPEPSTVTVTVSADDKAATETAAATEPAAPVATPDAQAPVVAAPSGALDFGSCTDPTVEFGPGFEGRKLSENSFKPVNKNEFNQASALNGQIVLNAICNILNDKCQAPADTVAACKAAITAVANVAGGAKADQFNAALGITTDFANVPAAAGGGVGSAALASAANFNKCSTPQIAFGIFDGRTENSFAPVGAEFQHGSALNPNIITRFVCDQLVNKCDANTVAINDCAAAITATNGLSGQALVDAFNSAVSANA